MPEKRELGTGMSGANGWGIHTIADLALSEKKKKKKTPPCSEGEIQQKNGGGKKKRSFEKHC